MKTGGFFSESVRCGDTGRRTNHLTTSKHALAADAIPAGEMAMDIGQDTLQAVRKEGGKGLERIGAGWRG